MFYSKYEPKNLEDIIGHEEEINLLKTIIQDDINIHGLIISGGYGNGKTLLAKIFARYINCKVKSSCEKCDQCKQTQVILNNVDKQQINAGEIILIDGAQQSGVNAMRDVLNENTILHPPLNLKYRVIIIDEAHMLSKTTMSNLLVILQSPPKFLKIIFTTTDPDKILSALSSRCLHIHLQDLSYDQISNYLKKICKQENIDINAKTLDAIIRSSNFSVRQSLSNLDKVCLLPKNTDLEKALNYPLESTIIDIYECVETENVESLKEKLTDLCDKVNAIKILRQTFNFVTNKLFALKDENKDTKKIQQIFLQSDILFDSILALYDSKDKTYEKNVVIMTFLKITYLDDDIVLKNLKMDHKEFYRSFSKIL